MGPKKLRVVVGLGLSEDDTPSERTIARILQRAGEVRSRRRPPRLNDPRAKDAPNPIVNAPNDLWTVDFKGWWNARDGAKFEPLTIRDGFSRYVLKAKLMTETGTEPVREEFEELFARRGIPRAVQVDNGPPFGSTQARCSMTTLSPPLVEPPVRLERRWDLRLAVGKKQLREAFTSVEKVAGTRRTLRGFMTDNVSREFTSIEQLEDYSAEFGRRVFRIEIEADAQDGYGFVNLRLRKADESTARLTIVDFPDEAARRAANEIEEAMVSTPIPWAWLHTLSGHAIVSLVCAGCIAGVTWRVLAALGAGPGARTPTLALSFFFGLVVSANLFVEVWFPRLVFLLGAGKDSASQPKAAQIMKSQAWAVGVALIVGPIADFLR